MTTSPQDGAAEAFATELARWRIERGLAKNQRGGEGALDPPSGRRGGGGRHRPPEHSARRAEAVLQADGEIWLRYTEYEELRRTVRTGQAGPVVSEQWLPPGTGLVVEHETATLSYVDGVYHCTIQRALYNAGPEPVIRYPIRIAVDRYPSEPERSNRFYREHPLTWEELDLTAIFGTAPGERMRLRPIYDRDSFKEIWLLFENDQGRFPLYRGQRVTITYAYRVGEDKWGQWFQRAVRLPTRRLSVHLDFPAALEPMVWGVQTSLTAESALRTPVERTAAGERVVFVWSTDHPPMHTRFRLEWRFRSPVPHQRQPDSAVAARASDRMLAAGHVQRGGDRLRQPARPLNLPTDEARAHDVVALLRAALDRVGELHSFSKGVGLAAPQLGLAWAAAVIRPPEDKGEAVVLLNPRVVGSSAETDEQYEGCLSFFDVRGLVRRPLRLLVEHESYGGGPGHTAVAPAQGRVGRDP